MTQLNEIKRMQLLAGIISESQLNEDLLELKQMSKQLYSFLKQKGFPVEIVNKLTVPLNPKNPTGSTLTTDTAKVKSQINVETVQIIVQEGQNREMVTIAVTPSNVARVLVGGKDDWSYKAKEKFGNDWDMWFKNPEILKYVNTLGNELLAQIKERYPNMVYKFEQKDFYYLLHFTYAQTKKGGQVNPNQRPNAPKPLETTPVAESTESQLDTNKMEKMDEMNSEWEKEIWKVLKAKFDLDPTTATIKFGPNGMSIKPVDYRVWADKFTKGRQTGGNDNNNIDAKADKIAAYFNKKYGKNLVAESLDPLDEIINNALKAAGIK